MSTNIGSIFLSMDRENCRAGTTNSGLKNTVQTYKAITTKRKYHPVLLASALTKRPPLL